LPVAKTPVNWYHAPTTLKAIDRLVCADGGNPDPSSTHGKKSEEAKALELKSWSYPRHLAGRHFGVVAHGDSVGAETLRRSLVDWLTDMSLISAGGMAETDGYIGYMKPYATAHQALDEDKAFQEEVLNVARTLGKAVILYRSGNTISREKAWSIRNRSSPFGTSQPPSLRHNAHVG
jgi:multimeric flavodoxin WrbA